MQNKTKNIFNKLPSPSYCDACCSLNIQYVLNDAVYGATFGEWPYVWFCHDCRASVGCHNGTSHPLGRMADRATKKLRKDVHDSFDRIWRSSLMTRDRAYIWLAHELHVDPAHCHISWLSKDQLKQALQLSNAYYVEREQIIERRKAKRTDAHYKTIAVEKKHIARRKRMRA